MSKKNSKNYLEFVPVRKIERFTEENGVITLEIENKGVFNRVAQKLLKKPKISYIHLDEMGSFVWPLIDGERNITDIGVFVKEHFGEKAEPLYERLAKYFKVLESYDFVEFKK
ncbi:MAG: PqqD family protein [Clostridia bacterium]|nr:PqqD family protein [Clostridia bacterium]